MPAWIGRVPLLLSLLLLASCSPSQKSDVILFVLEPKGEWVAGQPSHGDLVASVAAKFCPRCRVQTLTFGNLPGEYDPRLFFLRLDDVLEYKRIHPDHRVFLNLSFGSYLADNQERERLATLEKKGVVVIGAVGNDNTDKPFYPSAYPEVKAVAAVGEGSGFKTGYSNYGKHVDLAAPGWSRIFDRKGWYNARGTSFAAPLVMALAGRVAVENPSLSAQEAYKLLELAARPSRDPLFSRGVLGRGIVDGELLKEILSPPKGVRLIGSLFLLLGTVMVFSSIKGTLEAILSLRRLAKGGGGFLHREEVASLHALFFLEKGGRLLGGVAVALSQWRGEALRGSFSLLFQGLSVWAILALVPRLIFRLRPENRTLAKRQDGLLYSLSEAYALMSNTYAEPLLRRKALIRWLQLGRKGLVPRYLYRLRREEKRREEPLLRPILAAEREFWGVQGPFPLLRRF